MIKYNFSVIVLCYEPDIKKLFQTLYSIIIQTNVTFEILIADDGSKKPYQQQMIEWFEEKQFINYKLIMNKENQGTVRNLLSALDVAEGKYSKNISPGDYLYDENVLANAYQLMEYNSLRICFGKAAYYSCEEGEVILYNKANPIDIKPYKKKRIDKIRRNYFMFRDYILGASFVFDIQVALEYTRKIVDGVKYAEDTAVIAMLAAGEEIGFLDKYIVWYEYGTGISTSSNNKWTKIIYNENKYVFEILSKENKEVKKAYQFHFKKQISNKYMDMMRKIILYPPYLIFTIKAMKTERQVLQEPMSDIQKLEKILK